MNERTPKLLLSSVFKPFGVDDEYGVKENVMELMHNQVTRGQGVFSIHSHNRSFGLTMMAENLRVPATVLDFPTLDEFISELGNGGYTHLGISFIVPNYEKARRMASLARSRCPGITIWLGGHGTMIPGIESLIDCDGICRGEGIRWLRAKFGENPDDPIGHPVMKLDCYRKLIGVPAPHNKAVLIPAVGCRNKCNFCCTSHFFGGYTSFFPDPAALFEVMERIGDALHTDEFFVMDENFLQDPAKVDRLISLMIEKKRSFSFDIFASLDTVAKYDPLTLFRLGVKFVWIGVESRKPLFEKVRDLDARRIIRGLKRYGISVLASSIVFLDHHDRASLEDDVDFAIGLAPDFIQFMELAPLPGTTLFKAMQEQGRILDRIPFREWHGQDRIWFKHPVFSREETKTLLDHAFQRDFQELGPSLLRIAETRIRALDSFDTRNDPLLVARMEDLRRGLIEMRPLLPAMVAMAPNPRIRTKAERTAELFRSKLGPTGTLDFLSGSLVDLLARLEQGRNRKSPRVHQPDTYRQEFRQ